MLEWSPFTIEPFYAIMRITGPACLSKINFPCILLRQRTKSFWIYFLNILISTIPGICILFSITGTKDTLTVCLPLVNSIGIW